MHLPGKKVFIKFRFQYIMLWVAVQSLRVCFLFIFLIVSRRDL